MGGGGGGVEWRDLGMEWGWIGYCIRFKFTNHKSSKAG